MKAVELLKEYEHLQRTLVEKLLVQEPSVDRVSMTPLKRGTMLVNGQLWEYQKHGHGVWFGSPSGIEVDAHVGMAFCPHCFDEWRLYWYFESINCREATFAGKAYPLNEHQPLQALLDDMCETGACRIVIYEDLQTHRLYELVSGEAEVLPPRVVKAIV